ILLSMLVAAGVIWPGRTKAHSFARGYSNSAVCSGAGGRQSRRLDLLPRHNPRSDPAPKQSPPSRLKMSIRRRTWTTPRGEPRSPGTVDYVAQAGERHIATLERRIDAVAYDAEVRTAVRAGTHTAPSRSPTVTEAITDWLERAQLEQVERATLK